MNKNAQKWVEVLKSGEYKQSEGALKNKEGYCCLGVACELYRKEHPEYNWGDWSNSIDGYKFMDKGEFLPAKVKDWLNLSSDNGVFSDDTERFESLTQLNDTGKSFEEIAKLIESEPEGLFKETKS